MLRFSPLQASYGLRSPALESKLQTIQSLQALFSPCICNCRCCILPTSNIHTDSNSMEIGTHASVQKRFVIELQESSRGSLYIENHLQCKADESTADCLYSRAQYSSEESWNKSCRDAKRYVAQDLTRCSSTDIVLEWREGLFHMQYMRRIVANRKTDVVLLILRFGISMQDSKRKQHDWGGAIRRERDLLFWGEEI